MFAHSIGIELFLTLHSLKYFKQVKSQDVFLSWDFILIRFLIDIYLLEFQPFC